MTRKVIRTGPEDNYTAVSKAEAHRNLRQHLLMMLEAMQYKGNIDYMGNDKLRDLVEEQKIVFLRKLQAG